MATYSDARFGLVRRIVSGAKDDSGATGQAVSIGGAFSFPKKTKIVKFGIIPTSSDLACSTTSTFTLETEAGTDLGTFVPGSAVLGTGTATGVTITATTVAANKVICGNVSEVTDGGTFLWFVDVQEQFDATAND